MRIRKRFPPPSDPQLNTNNESLPSDLPNLNLPQPSDQQPPVTGPKPTTTWVFFRANSSNQHKLQKKDIEAEAEEEEEKLWREKKESYGGNSNDNDNKKELRFLSTPQQGSLLPQPSSSSDDLEDRKVIPLKKRSRDSYHHHNTSNINTMKSKTNKKFPSEFGNEEEQEHEHYQQNNSDHKVGHVVNKNKSKRGSVILEGSRCSRVNGRGWRCCQQTLVGYSLCEHHLGKGRLRSINNNTVRNSMNNKKKKKEEEEEEEEEEKEKLLSNDHEYYGIEDDDDDDEDDKKKSLMTMKKTKKMKKLGMVKARSLSSLLGQTDNAVTTVVVVDNDNKNE